MGSGGTGSHREWIQTGCRAQTLISTGISKLKCLLTANIVLYSAPYLCTGTSQKVHFH